MCPDAALSRGVGLVDAHSDARKMHTVNPNEMFLVIIIELLKADLIAVGFDDADDGKIQLSKEATLAVVEEPKDLHYMQGTASALRSTMVQTKAYNSGEIVCTKKHKMLPRTVWADPSRETWKTNILQSGGTTDANSSFNTPLYFAHQHTGYWHNHSRYVFFH